MNVSPTPAMVKGNALLAQCRTCGVLVYVPHPNLTVRHLAPCPSCGTKAWQQVTQPVGPFKQQDGAA